MRFKSTCFFCMLLPLTACTVGPEYRRPAIEAPPDFQASPDAPRVGTASAATRVTVDSDPDPTWWREFNDPVLTSLEERAMSGNIDLQGALLRIVQARLQIQSARAQGLPSLSASASYKREQLGAKGLLKSERVDTSGGKIDPALISAITKDVNLYQIGFDASWELDLFGKVRRSVEQAKAQADEQVHSHNDMLVSLQAEVATDYFQLRAAQLQAAFTTELIRNANEIVALTKNRQEHGLQGQADVESAKAQVTGLESQLPQYEQQAAATRHALSVLLGQDPQSFDQQLSDPADFPPMPALIPVGIPAGLARRRPDVRQAEAAVHVATAEVGVSLASLYPDVSLSGMLGLRNSTTSYLFDWASRFYTVGPTVSLPIFKGGSLIANVKIARADEASAVLSYRKAVLTALQEVEDGLVSLDTDQRRVTATRATVEADQHALDINQHSFKIGLVNYIGVLNAQVQRDQAKLQLAQATATQMGDLVKLYKALAGGWSAPGSASVALSDGE